MTARLRRVVRTLVTAVLFGLFLAFAGVGTAVRGGFVVRAAYLTAISMVGVTVAISLWLVLQNRRIFVARRWLVPLAVGLLQAPIMALVVWGGDSLILARPLRGADLPGYLAISLGVSVFVNLIVYLLARERVVTVTASAPEVASVRFLDRLPPKLRGGEIWAVEAEDHYLRLHTSKGQDLILVRLADAVSELEGLEGAQVHRSWWVARAAISDISRADGRATLTLKDGSQVPVSRTYAKLLRERGWM